MSTPIETVFLNRVEEKVPIAKLKKSIRRVFSQCGTIVSIEAKRSLKRRGQAFITYTSTEESKRAVERFQDFRLFKNPISVTYARTNSDKLLQIKGEYGKLQERRRIRKKRATAATKKQRLQDTRGKSETPLAASGGPSKSKGIDVEEWKLLPPHNILLLHAIGLEHTKESIAKVFESNGGLTDVRYVSVRQLAFIEFDSEGSATLCLHNSEKNVTAIFGPEAFLSYARK